MAQERASIGLSPEPATSACEVHLPTLNHDQLFKELLHAFFPEFLTLFFPAVAARLDLSTPEAITFLDRELFTDLPRGEQREPDVVAQVRRRDGTPQAVLIHVELERRRRARFPERMFDYFCLLRMRHHLHVLPIVLYLSPGTGGRVLEQYDEEALGIEVVRFWYSVIGLPDLEGADYRAGESALGSALAALMKPGEVGRPRHKALCLLGVARHVTDEARQALLQHVIESYARLNENEEREFAALLDEPPLQEVKAMISPYELRGIEKGRLEEKREAIRQIAQLLQGSVSPSLEVRLQNINSLEELNHLQEETLLSCLRMQDDTRPPIWSPLALLDEPPLREGKAIISPYELRGIERGREEGELRGKRDLVRQTAQTLLGSVSASLESKLSQANSPEELDRLHQEVLQSYLRALDDAPR